MEHKLKSLQDALGNMGRLTIALSGGIDSMFLLRVAAEAIPGQVVALTAVSMFLPDDDLEAARNIAKETHTPHHLIDFSPLQVPHFAENPPERCYHCKKALCLLFWSKARELGIENLADGTNADDRKDFRPGLKAAAELSVSSPLSKLNITKDEIRTLSRKLGLSRWDKPSSPCLATRFPYGQPITAEAVERVKKAEDYLKSQGFSPVRVRSYGDKASVEVETRDIRRFTEDNRLEYMTNYLKKLGFSSVALNREGYNPGNLNTPLSLANHSTT